MRSLSLADLNRLDADVDSFLGRALALGHQVDRLPDAIADVLMAFLRMHGLAYAQRYRAGISVGRDVLERGITQALNCLDMGLAKAADGDVDEAVALLEGGDFERLRKLGWELAFQRLVEMRELCAECCRRGGLRFQLETRDEIETWSRIVPETWTAVGETEEVEVDPRLDFDEFTTIRTRVAFVASLPATPLEQLAAAAGGSLPFPSLLQHLVVTLAADRKSLLVDKRVAARMRTRLNEDPTFLHLALPMIAQQAQVLDGPAARDQIIREAAEQIEFLQTQRPEKWELYPLLVRC